MRKASVLLLALIAVSSACDKGPTAPAATRPGPTSASGNCITQPGQQSIRTLASKRIVYGWELYGCSGPGAFETYFEFRSIDQWICYTDMSTYYTYYPYDDAECGWYAG